MLKILVADDSEVVRQLLKAGLSREKDWSVCGEAGNGQQAVLLAHQCKPDLIVMDLAMPLLDGLHAAAEIQKFAAGLPIVLYTLHNAPAIELEAKKAGIKAVVSKSENLNVLLETIKGIAAESAGTSTLATMSSELFTAKGAPPEAAAESESAAPELRAAAGASAAQDLAIGAATQAIEAPGDNSAVETGPPSTETPEPPPGVS